MKQADIHNTSGWRPLQKMFNEVPRRYDLLNRVITWGLDEYWRKLAARECLSGNPGHVLDLCTGTGDLVLRMARNANGHTDFAALDFSKPMLEVAQRKSHRKSRANVRFIHGDAAEMPFKDMAFDVVGIGFAFRNLTWKNRDRTKYLAEIHRVLHPGGRFVIIESSQPQNPVVKSFFRLYLRIFVRGLGGRLSGHPGAYRYLASSARDFYTPEKIREMLLGAGFTSVEHKSLALGVAGLTTAIK